jgi:hypothetical protein
MFLTKKYENMKFLDFKIFDKWNQKINDMRRYYHNKYVINLCDCCEINSRK